jgi:Xaa-Pro aminopeptidase
MRVPAFPISALREALLAVAILALPLAAQAPTTDARPFGTLREQAAIQQHWLEQRMETILPALMRQHGVEMWVVPMREYNEDPLFTSLVAPTTFAARRRTIYVFHDRGPDRGVERIALGGSSQGGVYRAVRSTRRADADVAGRQAELWGDEQWVVLRELLEERQPSSIAINISRVHAFADGLSAGEYEGMSEALGERWTSRFRRSEGMAVDLIAARLPGEADVYERMNALVWELVSTMFSERVITPGVTRTSDVVWWFRQRVNDLGLGTWFQPSVSVQRRGGTAESIGEDPIIQRGDVLHCDVGITVMRLNTDTQHMGYVLREGEAAPPQGLRSALARSNRLQDILMEELPPGRTGNEILHATRARMRAEGIDGTVYTHPIGMHGHGAGATIGLWDRQEGVPGRGDHRVIANSWYSIELQATSEIPEWGGQRVRSMQEEDAIIGADGYPRWAHGRQASFHLVR